MTGVITCPRGYGKMAALNYARYVQRMGPPQPTPPGIGNVRWACTSPTGYISLSPVEEMFRGYTRGMVDGLAGRPYRETSTPDLLDMIIKAKEAARDDAAYRP